MPSGFGCIWDMAELHVHLDSIAPTTRWGTDDDSDFDAEAMERAIVTRRRELFADLADLSELDAA